MTPKPKRLEWTDTEFHRFLVKGKFKFLQSNFPNTTALAHRFDRSLVLEDPQYEVRTFDGEETLKERVREHLDRAWHIAINNNATLPDPDEFRISVIPRPGRSWIPFLKHYFVSIQILAKISPGKPTPPKGPSSAA